MGTELEVSRLLAAHVRWLKPRLVIETGTFRADTTSQLYLALVENAREGFPGILRSYEVDPVTYAEAVRRMSELVDHDEHPDAQLYLLPHTLQEDDLSGAVDFAFVDSAYATREADVQTLMPMLSRHGLCFVHDAVKRPLRDTLRSWRREYRVVQYPTARGLALLQRRGS